MKLGLSLLLLISLSSFADDQLENTEYYQKVLDRHVARGHIKEKDIEKQRFYYEKDKVWRKKYNSQVRGIASSLKSPRDIIELDNPAIEIPVK